MMDIKTIAMILIFMLTAFSCGIVVGHFLPLASSTSVIAAEGSNLVPMYDQSFNGMAVNTSLSSNFVICLPENGGSTGFLWDPTSTQGLDLLESKYIPGNKSLIGGHGTRQWLFRASWPGEQHFKATLHRSWENLTGTEETFNITINVS